MIDGLSWRIRGRVWVSFRKAPRRLHKMWCIVSRLDSPLGFFWAGAETAEDVSVLFGPCFTISVGALPLRCIFVFSKAPITLGVELEKACRNDFILRHILYLGDNVSRLDFCMFWLVEIKKSLQVGFMFIRVSPKILRGKNKVLSIFLPT